MLNCTSISALLCVHGYVDTWCTWIKRLHYLLWTSSSSSSGKLSVKTSKEPVVGEGEGTSIITLWNSVGELHGDLLCEARQPDWITLTARLTLRPFNFDQLIDLRSPAAAPSHVWDCKASEETTYCLHATWTLQNYFENPSFVFQNAEDDQNNPYGNMKRIPAAKAIGSLMSPCFGLQAHDLLLYVMLRPGGDILTPGRMVLYLVVLKKHRHASFTSKVAVGFKLNDVQHTTLGKRVVGMPREIYRVVPPEQGLNFHRKCRTPHLTVSAAVQYKVMKRKGPDLLQQIVQKLQLF